CLPNIRRAGDKRRLRLDRAIPRHPGEGITPTIFLVAGTATYRELVQKVDRLFQVGAIQGAFVKESVSHRIMRIRYRKSCGMMEESTRTWQKRFQENHRRDGRCADKLVPVV